MRGWQAGIVAALLWTAPAQALELVETEALSPRLTEHAFTTDALTAETRVRVLTPAGYDPKGTKRYPVLLLLHGAVDDYKSWTAKGDAEAATAPYDVIVVMPDTGQFGGYTDWYNDGAFGPPEWERFHIQELLPWVDANYRTTGTRAGRAVAGLSMGGGGTMKYAAAYPHRFTAAYAFSPAVNSNDPTLIPVTTASGLYAGSRTPGAIYGLRPLEEVRWRNENGWDLAENLAGLDLALITRNGSGDTFDPVEYSCHEQALAMHTRLDELGIPHLWDDQGPGGHTWTFWQQDLKASLPRLMARFAARTPRPRRITHKRADPDFSVYGWRVHIERPAMEFATLAKASRHGFTLSGSGTGTVRSPRFFKPGERLAGGLRAGRRGRVTVTVDLGPGNAMQQYRPGAETKVVTQRVRFR